MARSSIPPVVASLLVAAFVACGGGGDGGDAASTEQDAAAETAASASCVADHADSPCDLLTADLVHGAIADAPAELEQDSYTGSSFSSCTYGWPSDRMETREVAGRSITYAVDNSVRLAWIQPLESADPRDEFRRKYLPTREEVQRGMEAMDRELDARVEEGEMTEAQRETAGDVVRSVPGGMEFAPVDGVGDMASWSGSTLYVMDGSTSFQVESDVSAETSEDREAAVAIARAVMDACE